MSTLEVFHTMSKEEPKAPPFSWTDVVLAITSAVYAGGGFGQRFVSEAAFIISLLTLIIWERGLKCAALLLILGFCIYQPALMQASPLLAALLIGANRPKQGIIVLIGSSLQLFGGLNPYYIPLILIPLVGLCAIDRWRLNGTVIKILTVAFLAMNILPTLLPLKAPIGHQQFAYPYRIDVAKRMEKSDGGETYSSIDDHGDHRNADILVLEHDPPHGLATENWSQKRLWSENYYFGAPLYRVATTLDGFLYSNLGCKVGNSTIRFLGEAHRTEHNAFISRGGGRTIFSDSDFLNNGAVGYQMHLNSALFERFSLSQAILLFSALASVLALIPKTRVLVTPILITLAISVCIALHNQKIDVRIVTDRQIWPHSKGVAGIGSEINEVTGVITVSRQGKSKILGLARDCTGSHNGERVVVMEGGSIVRIGETLYSAMDLPMGESSGVLDAIPICKLGSNASRSSIVRVDGVTLIGTNSARVNWRKIYELAE
jgi:hypothetical protein